MLANKKVEQSRGNPNITFSVSDRNQFYRFVKNRVMYLIPGTYGDDTRPADLELGDLSNVHLGKGDIYRTTGGSW